MWKKFNAAIVGRQNDEGSISIQARDTESVSLIPTSLDAIGQRDEAIRQRISEMQDRLEDMKSLSGEFLAIVSPIEDIAAELPKATARIIELENALAQARQSVAELRQENASLAGRSATLTQDLTAAQARAAAAERDLGTHQEELAEVRVLLRDRELAVEDFERRLFAESEQATALAGECKALRQEAQAADAALSRSEHELGAARERASLIEADNVRLNQLAGELTAQIGDLQSRLQEVEAARETERQAKQGLEDRLALEGEARQRAEAQLEVETNAFRTERATFAMKLDAVRHRSATSDQILARLRTQLREQEEAMRSNERTLKEALIARASTDRRLEALKDDLSLQGERFLKLQKARDEFAARCEMLSKAISAKDVQLSQATTRAAGLEDRIEQLTFRLDAQRLELEAANRRLAEELDNERSERALLQGALEIARESRAQLKKQHDALKRASRGAPDSEPRSDADEEPTSNVHPLVPAKG